LCRGQLSRPTLTEEVTWTFRLTTATRKSLPSAGHWKAAIDVTIDASIAEIGLIKEAVTFYTGSVARVSIVSYGTGVGGATTVRARVQAAGYYATIGA
jgi:hypothetical protein